MNAPSDADQAGLVETANQAADNAAVEATDVRKTSSVVEAAAVVEAAEVIKAAAVDEAEAVVEAGAVVEAATVVKAATVVEVSAVLLKRLLRMADGYQATNDLHQAAEMYFELADCYPDTLEGVRARKCLLDIGESYERKGELRQARSIFERLLETAP